MFPFVMIGCTLIFFDYQSVKPEGISESGWVKAKISKPRQTFLCLILSAHFIFQLLLPIRYLCYSGKLGWTEQGYRFSWRVMLIEKMGIAQFTIVDSRTNEKIYISNNQYLTVNQEKMMATQPDMVLQYAHLLRDKFKSKKWTNPQIYVESYAVLNGTGSRMFIDPQVNLAAIEEGFEGKNWILPYKETQ